MRASDGVAATAVEAKVSRELLARQKTLLESTDPKYQRMREARQQLPAHASRAQVCSG